jgi:hypothetical protein
LVFSFRFLKLTRCLPRRSGQGVNVAFQHHAGPIPYAYAPHCLCRQPPPPCSVLERALRIAPHSSNSTTIRVQQLHVPAFSPQSLCSPLAPPRTPLDEPPGLCGQLVHTFLCSPRPECSPSTPFDILAPQEHVIAHEILCATTRNTRTAYRHPRYALLFALRSPCGGEDGRHVELPA